MGFCKKWRRGQFFRRLFALLCLFVPIFCILGLLSPGLPELAPNSRSEVMASKRNVEGETKLGELGLLMIKMLPENLAFTVFLPSEKAFDHVLKLQSNSSLMTDKMNDTFAILSQIMGFCTVPQHIPSESVPVLKELQLDSVSGFIIYVWKMPDGALLVNNIRSEQVDLRKGEIIVHVMEGVIMDAEFEQSFIPDYEE
ncbi:uncharacterized protein LOC110106374 [Dendrobium catenatum]|uniref:FAS1 domain-containing protein n=1 Tax=Dendrobium catenatum TaxID=906689 RepID=A0A2I0VLT2_9ASPA|nr:uncharacterized protein LOC110106374 [Dendrobium catenatum]PKU64378.1 hypothetical protein MA16_Dca005301 [Dendrobium catenatum]